MSDNRNPVSGEAAVSAATVGRTQTARLRLQRAGEAGFTLAELLVSVAVLVLLVVLMSQVLQSAATITTRGHKQMDADGQARQLLDRMGIDFAQMVKRSDVDYYVKSSAPSPQRRVAQPGNDQIGFYSAVPGYYPATGSQSPLSLVAYRVNSSSTSASYNKTERLGKGLVWNAVSTTDTPVVFMPIPIASPLPNAELPVPTPNPLPTPAWPQAADMTPDTAYELIGPHVFRFEYYYLLKDGTFSDNPMLSPHTSISGMQDVSAIVVDIAVIDPRSRTLVSDCLLSKFNGAPPPAGCSHGAPLLVDYSVGMAPGQLLASWRSAIDANAGGLPRPAISGIRLYERFFYLSPPTL
jgi:type II secretory pathway component PulJ